VTQHRPIACDNNPRVGRSDEVDWRPAPAPVRKRVIIVGAGIAGMEAAWIAAARGHHVTVYGRSAHVGGKTRLRAQLPGGEALSSIYDYQHAQAIKSGARLELGVTVSAADVIALNPDAVVLACGAEMLAPSWLPREAREANLVQDVRSAMAGLRGHTAHQRGSAVIVDTDHTDGTYAAAEQLHAIFERVFVITPREAIAQDVPLVTRQGIYRRLSEKRIHIVTSAEPRWSERCEDGIFEYVNVYNGDTGMIEDVAFLAYSSPRAPQAALAEPLRAAGIDVKFVGDCLSPRGVMAATAEGHEAGNEV
jgi:thioredoxin reductase